MKLANVKLQGFRNFKSANINFKDKTLIIGANDVGKTNLIWALRLLLDKGLSEYDVEPKDSDFYAYEETNFFEIRLTFEDVVEDCVVSKLKGKISDDDQLILVYRAMRDSNTLSKKYSIHAGSSIGTLEELEDRYYRKVLNLRYISSRRDLFNYINKEKNNLIQIAKQNREDEDVIKDDKLYGEIAEGLKKVDEKIPELSYIASATHSINEELDKLSIHHKKQKVVFDASSSNVDSFINNVAISSKNNNKSLLIGGDGRLNQIYLSLWAARNEISEDNLQEVSIICIEEPEAHLHPHQQRKLAEYLGATIKTQVVITTHSPQIASEYSPNSIIRLFDKGQGTKAASEGCSKIIADSFEDFGYRMSIIPAESFFADAVLLVEGPSEELFYKTLAKQLGLDLDRLNISVMMVDGVGFATFISILSSLEIAWVLRTDNDIFKTPKKNEYRMAGVQRLIGFYRELCKKISNVDDIINLHEKNISTLASAIPSAANINAATEICNALESLFLFISQKDLENDLFDGPLKSSLTNFFAELDESEIVLKMQERKATFMHSFLKAKKASLSSLAKDPIAKPLFACKKIVESFGNAAN